MELVMGGEQRPPPMDYGSGKSAMDERVKRICGYFLLTIVYIK